ncbi:MAG: hypothetical protein AAF604_08245 [Acidobacteriota bacterium]
MKSTFNRKMVVFCALLSAFAGLVGGEESKAAKAAPGNEDVAEETVMAPTANAMWVVRDAVTGKLRAATADELRRAGHVGPVANESSEGLVAIRGIDGSLKVDLKERFYHSSFARIDADGKLHSHCDDDGNAAIRLYRERAAARQQAAEENSTEAGGEN